MEGGSEDMMIFEFTSKHNTHTAQKHTQKIDRRAAAGGVRAAEVWPSSRILCVVFSLLFVGMEFG